MEISVKMNQTLNEIKSFFKKNDIQFFHIQKKRNLNQIEFKLNIISYTSETSLADSFHFILEIEEIPEIELFNIYTKKNCAIPFHPHFQIYYNLSTSTLITKQAKWIDYSNQQGDVVTFIKRVIFSLQYNKGYINLNAKKIGNKKAKVWYLEEDYKKAGKFPTDNFLVNHIKVNDKSTNKVVNTAPSLNLNFESKRFDIDAKSSNAKKFTITDETKYYLEQKFETDFNFQVDETLSSQIKTSSITKLYVSTIARKQIFEHIKWGNLQTPKNRNEQGGILLGKVFIDKSNKFQFGIVEQVVYSENTIGNPVSLEMSHEVWSKMLNDADNIIENNQNDNIQVIGWYHTHPNNLDVFMSSTDMNTQERFFNQTWHYAIVLNPHKQIWKAFVGSDAKECQGFFLRDYKYGDSNLNNNSEEKKTHVEKINLLKWVLITLVISTVTIFFIINSGGFNNENLINTNEKTRNETRSTDTYLISKTGDTIDFFTYLEFDSDFSKKIFVKMNDAKFDNDLTIIQFNSPVFIKDSIYSKIGKLRNNLRISTSEIDIDSSKRWISFHFLGKIKSKDE